MDAYGVPRYLPLRFNKAFGLTKSRLLVSKTPKAAMDWGGGNGTVTLLSRDVAPGVVRFNTVRSRSPPVLQLERSG